MIIDLFLIEHRIIAFIHCLYSSKHRLLHIVIVKIILHRKIVIADHLQHTASLPAQDLTPEINMILELAGAVGNDVDLRCLFFGCRLHERRSKQERAPCDVIAADDEDDRIDLRMIPQQDIVGIACIFRSRMRLILDNEPFLYLCSCLFAVSAVIGHDLLPIPL